MSRLQERLGKALRRLREERGLSQEAFAARAGVHRTTMGRLEGGAFDLSLSTLEQLANGLDLSVSALLAEAEATDLRRRGRGGGGAAKGGGVQDGARAPESAGE